MLEIKSGENNVEGADLERGQNSRTSVLLMCFSHLRWDFVTQRPQHLMTRFAQANKVIYWEEPRIVPTLFEPRLSLSPQGMSGVTVATPELPEGLGAHETTATLRRLLDHYLAGADGQLVLWYYTPMMLDFSQHVDAACVVYDCMDELANFKFAPRELLQREQQLLQKADLVFTGGYSLYETKRDRHPHVTPFPSSVDRDHFLIARERQDDPEDQSRLPRPRLGFCGVIDERMDLELLASLADARPHWSIVMVGPVVKISEADLPQRPNIHYLGGRTYEQLPVYLANWDVALMPFAMNEATRFISPTKTPEYLTAGCPVVSTPITDVVRHYSGLAAVTIATDAGEFVDACEAALELQPGGEWLTQADVLLTQTSWDETARQMWALVADKVSEENAVYPIVSPTRWPPTRAARYDVLVVGAGFAGAVMAERLASQLDMRVLVVDRRPHIGGNAYDCIDAAGMLIHQYGPHIFHTNSADIFEYLSQFTAWRPYEHRVRASVDDMLVPVPINRTTINALYQLGLTTDEEVERLFASRAEAVPDIQTSEDVVVSMVGRELYEKFFRGYTRKQWGLDPSQLDKSVAARVPTRTSTDDRYFTDKFQAMPTEGYTRMFERMLDHPNIDLLLGVDYQRVRDAYPHEHLVFTGPIDEYFGYRFGRLPYRSLRFDHETLDQEWHQPVAVINYPDIDVPFTRITEYKHLTGQQNRRTSITREYPQAEGDPYYPIPRPENQTLFKRYEALARAEDAVTFVGRLATYRYYNMDQIVGQALATFRKDFLDVARTRSSRVARVDEKAAAVSET